jgi:hypothetical protein
MSWDAYDFMGVGCQTHIWKLNNENFLMKLS